MRTIVLGEGASLAIAGKALPRSRVTFFSPASTRHCSCLVLGCSAVGVSAAFTYDPGKRGAVPLSLLSFDGARYPLGSPEAGLSSNNITTERAAAR
jgi:hypothetical protein